MASRNTVITHIGDDLFYELILREAKGEGKSKSEYVRDILMKELSDKLDDLNSSFNDNYAYERNNTRISVYPANTTIDSSLYYRGVRGRMFKLNKVDDTLTGVYESPLLGLVNHSSKGLKDNAKKEAIRMLPQIIRERWHEIESLHGNTDVNLLFINRVEVSYEGEFDNKFHIRVSIHFYMSRFPLDAIDSDDFLRLDFLNIHYLRFKNVAINGRLYKKYDRLVYIAPSKETLLGGFFVGLFYKPKDKMELLGEIREIIDDQDVNRADIINIPGGFVKLHFNHELVKVNTHTFSKAYKVVLERRMALKKQGAYSR